MAAGLDSSLAGYQHGRHCVCVCVCVCAAATAALTPFTAELPVEGSLDCVEPSSARRACVTSRRQVISAMLLREDDSPETWGWSFFGSIRASRTALIWHTTRFRHKLLRLAHTSLERTTASTEQHAECAICFEDLCAQPIVIFEKKRGLRRRIFRRPARRVCGHFFHESCAAQLKPQLCPLCRTSFHRCRRMPSIEDDPLGWFQCVDVDGEGRLTRDQVKDALATCFPLDVPRLEASLDELWAQWDVSSSGFIDKPAFLAPGELAVPEPFRTCPAPLHSPVHSSVLPRCRPAGSRAGALRNARGTCRRRASPGRDRRSAGLVRFL